MTHRPDDGPVKDAPQMGVLPALPPDALPDKQPRTNAATAASAAGVRALSAQAVQFYFRAPVKAFFRTRVDYLAYARSSVQEHLSPSSAAGQPASPARRVWQWMRGSTAGVLGLAIRHHGWGVVPSQILPPLAANVGVGAVLYTSYLQILARLHEGSAKATRSVYPPPDPGCTFAAGFLAGSIQSLVAAPLDAIQARYDHRDPLSAGGRVPGNGNAGGALPRSMWAFGAEKLREIGPRGVFAGWGLSFLKDSFGNAVFFSTFEYVKAQGYHRFVMWYYGALDDETVDVLAQKRPTATAAAAAEGVGAGVARTVIRPHYALEPMFLLLAGISASFAQQVLLHPLTHIQVEHWDRLEDLDAKAAQLRSTRAAQPEQPKRRWRMVRAYYRAYRDTWAECLRQAAAEDTGMRRWLYRGFWYNTIRQVPSTSAGLIIFELVRRKYGVRSDEVRITKDGYDILLS